MSNSQKVRVTRRDMLKLSAGGAGLFMLSASGLAVPRGFGASGSGSVYLEAFPTSPLILNPFTDRLDPPTPLGTTSPTSMPGGTPDPMKQDSLVTTGANYSGYNTKYKQNIGTHQMFPVKGAPMRCYDIELK